MSDRLEKTCAALARVRAESRIDILAIEVMEEVISIITDIQSQLDGYEQQVQSVFTAIDTALSDFAAKVAALEATIASGGAPDPAQVAALQADITNAQALVAPELAKVQAADPGAQDPPPPPPATRSVYTFDGDPTTVDTSQWTLAPEETTDTPPRALYTYVGDTAPGQTNGDGLGGVWHLYTGPTQPVPPPAG